MNYHTFLAMAGDTCGGQEIIFVLDVTPATDENGPKVTYVNRNNLTPDYFYLDPEIHPYFEAYIWNNDVRTLIGRFFKIDFEFESYNPDENDPSEYFDLDGGCVGVKLYGIDEIK